MGHTKREKKKQKRLIFTHEQQLVPHVLHASKPFHASSSAQTEGRGGEERQVCIYGTISYQCQCHYKEYDFPRFWY